MIKKNVISDSMWIAVLTGGGYLAAFAYKCNYLRYFSVPSYFIDLNLTLILTVISVGVIVILLLGSNFVDLILYSPKKLSKVKRFFLSFLLLIIYAEEQSYKIIWMMMLANLPIFILIIKEILQDNKRDRVDQLILRIKESYGLLPIIAAFIFLLFIGYCFAIGFFEAQIKTNYLILNTEPKRFIISDYRESFIVATYNEDSRTFSGITLISQERISDEHIVITKEKIGPLIQK